MRQKLFEFTIMTLWGGYILVLAWTGKLGFFIHPRYFLFTASAAIVLFVVGLIGVAYVLWQQRAELEMNLRIQLKQVGKAISKANSLLTILWVLALAIALIVPPRSLSARSASQRTSINNAITTETVSAVNQFVRQRDSYGIGEWISEFKKNPNVADHVGQEVSVEGFILGQPEGDPNRFTVSKFVVRCCVVDASPLGIPVNYDWKSELKESQWVRVHGTFVKIEVDGQARIAIAADKIEVIDTPANPYIY
jgi:putative membrane protein